MDHLLARLFTAQCNPEKDSQLYVPESGKMKLNVMNQVVDIFRGNKDYSDD